MVHIFLVKGKEHLKKETRLNIELCNTSFKGVVNNNYNLLKGGCHKAIERITSTNRGATRLNCTGVKTH